MSFEDYFKRNDEAGQFVDIQKPRDEALENITKALAGASCLEPPSIYAMPLCEPSTNPVKEYEGELLYDWNGPYTKLLEWFKTPYGAMAAYELTRSHDLLIATDDHLLVKVRWQGAKGD